MLSCYKKNSLLLIIFFIFSAKAAEFPNLRFSNIGVNDGFAGQTFYFAYQDNHNFMWFGSHEGLYIWDGNRTKRYFHNSSDSTSISSSRVSKMQQIDDYRYAIACMNGVNIFDLRTETFSVLNFTKGAIILNLCLDQHNRLWIGTNRGLYMYNLSLNTYRHFNSSPSNSKDYLPGDYIISMLYEDNKICIGTHGYACFFDPQNDSFINFNLPKDYGIIICMEKVRGEDDKYWVGTDHILFMWNKLTGEIEPILTNIPIKIISYDKENNLLLGTDNGLYIKMNNSTEFKRYSRDVLNKQSIPSNIVWHTFLDNSNNLWACTTNGVAVSPLSDDIRSYNILDFLNISRGMQFFYLTTHKNDLILAGTNGAIVVDQSTRSSHWLHSEAKPENKLTHNRARHVYCDENDIYWIATDLGLNSYDRKTDRIKSYNIVESSNTYKSAWMYHIAKRGDQFYLSTYDGGVFVVNIDDLINSKIGEPIVATRHFSSTSKIQPIESNIISGVYFGDQNSYFSTWSDGIFKVPHNPNKSVIKLSYENQSLSSNFIISMVQVNDTTFAAASAQSIDLITPNTTKKSIFSINNNTINSITALPDNRLCVNTFSELYFINLADFSYTTLNTISLGLTPIQHIYYDYKSHLLYCGGIDKYTTINLDQINTKNSSFKPTLTYLILGNEVVTPSRMYNGRVLLQKPLFMSDTVVLDHTQNTISIEFSTLQYGNSSLDKYVYRMRGLSNEWIATNGENRATFSHLPHGKYLFEVALVQSNKIIANSIESISITVLPPFYQSTLAYVLYGVIFIFFIFLIIRALRVNQIKRLNLLEKEKNMKFSQMKIDFFTNTSHELKTPLSLLIGRLSNMILNEKNADKRKKLLALQNSAEQIKNLTLKNLKNIEGNQFIDDNLNLKPLEVSNFVNLICLAFEDKFTEKSLSFTLTTPREHTYSLIDSNMFASVIENLISNAIKFTPENGSICVSISKDDTVGTVSISISDTGCGIDPQKQAYIFERFYKVDLGTDGQGLGLAITKEIVEAHNGKIELTSNLNEGSTFTIILNTHKDNKLIHNRERSKKETTISILIVEDNDEMLEIICDGLSDNFNCLRAKDGTEAFQIALEQRPALIISDLMMPNMNGIELVEKIRQNIFISHIPIIILTACTDRGSEIESFSKGVDAYIHKPYDINDLTLRAWQLIKKSELQNEKSRQQALATVHEAEIISTDEKFIEKITRIIEEKISDTNLSLFTLSHDCGLSEKQIYRRLKQLTGLTPVEYIRKIRMTKAEMLLRHKGVSISEVLFMVGFSTPSYFTKCFKAHYNMTPSEYLESFKEKKE